MSVIEHVWALKQPSMFHFVNVILHNIYIVNDRRKSHPGTCSMASNCVEIKSTVIAFIRSHFHIVKPRLTATSLLRPLSFSRLEKTAIHFLVKKALVNTAIFFWPIGDRIKGVPLRVPLYFSIVPSLARSLRSSSLSGDFFSRSCALFQASSAHIYDSANWPGNKTAQISNTS